MERTLLSLQEISKIYQFIKLQKQKANFIKNKEANGNNYKSGNNCLVTEADSSPILQIDSDSRNQRLIKKTENLKQKKHLL